jgi:serine/threonine-protein kinase
MLTWVIPRGYANGRSAIEKALELDSGFAEAHASLGWIVFLGERDLRAAARQYSKALELEPGNGDVLSDATLLALALGRVAEAVSLGERALVRDPVNVRAYRYLAAAYIMADRSDDAEKNYPQALALRPGYTSGYFHLARVLLDKGDVEAALACIEQETHTGFKLIGLVLVHHRLGNTAESDAALAILYADWAEEAAYQIAEAHAFRDEKDSAFEWLSRAIGQNDPGASTLQIDPLLAGLHDDPRWLAILETLGITDAKLAAIEFDVLGTPHPK